MIKATFLVLKDVSMAVLKFIGLAVGLVSVLYSIYYLLNMIPIILLEGRLITFAESSGYSSQAIIHETYFFYAVLLSWILVGLICFVKAVQGKLKLLNK